MPGVANKDLTAAVGLQLDSLHPFADEEVYFSGAPIGNTGSVLIGIARREVIDRYVDLFAEAGVKIASFTFPAAVLYSASRIVNVPPARGFFTLYQSGGEWEAYGESESHPVYSATLPASTVRARAIAISELRLEPGLEPVAFRDLLPLPAVFPPNHDPDTLDFDTNAVAYAAGIVSACPWLSIEGNLLPPTMRQASSRVRLIPTVTLASVLALLLVALVFQSRYADSRYLGVLQHEIRRVDPAARRVDTLDKAITSARERTQALDDFRRRAKLDMDTLGAMTRLIPPPGWVSSLEMDRETINVSGEADQAAVLLKEIDGSPYFERSEFTMPISRAAVGEIFRIRALRETPPDGAAR
jgi:hypothetical protein